EVASRARSCSGDHFLFLCCPPIWPRGPVALNCLISRSRQVRSRPKVTAVRDLLPACSARVTSSSNLLKSLTVSWKPAPAHQLLVVGGLGPSLGPGFAPVVRSLGPPTPSANLLRTSTSTMILPPTIRTLTALIRTPPGSQGTSGYPARSRS